MTNPDQSESAINWKAEAYRLRAIMAEAAKRDPVTCRKWIKDALAVEVASDDEDARAAELAKANGQNWRELTESQRDDYRRLIRDAREAGRKAGRLASDEDDRG